MEWKEDGGYGLVGRERCSHQTRVEVVLKKSKSLIEVEHIDSQD